MPVPADFQFSQSSLQDYVDCPRRFQLRYMQHVAWPAVEAEPQLENERHRKMGELFHRLVQQHILGVPVERLSQMAACSRLGSLELEAWWQNYLKSDLLPKNSNEPRKYFSEFSLIGSLAGANLIAKYDAILISGTPENPSVTILDWKTTRQRSRRAWLAGRLQTRVYLYLITAVGACLNGGTPFTPPQVDMSFWFAGFPDNPERFIYSERQFEEDGIYLNGLIQRIQAAGSQELTTCADLNVCKFCVYRSLCERGVKPGNYEYSENPGQAPGQEDGSTEADLNFDFEQIGEIEF
jgi:hypothetical protein